MSVSVLGDEDSKTEVSTRRPASVIWYERLAWAALAVSLVSSAVAYRAIIAKYFHQDPVLYPIAIICAYAIQLWWIWLIARKRKNWARWISLIATAVGIPMEILHFNERFHFNAASTIISDFAFCMLSVAVLLLFRRDARLWFTSQPSAPDESLPLQN